MGERGRLGWVIVYVEDVPAAIDLYERAFGLERTFVTPDGSFGQLDTGATALAFAARELAAGNLPEGYRPADLDGPPGNVEIALVYDDVEAAYERALTEGCTSLAGPVWKPQGQTVAYLRDPFGTLVEVCSPVA